MVGSIRLVRVTLTSLAIVAGFGLSLPPRCIADDKPAEQDKKAKDQAGKVDGASKGDTGKKAATPVPAQSRVDLSKYVVQPGEDPPRPFVPLRPSTVDDRRRIEAVRLYTAARALEDIRRWPQAVELLEEALKLDPDSVAIARRLGRIYVGALGRPDLALQYGKRVLAIEPGDTDTLARLVDHYNKNEPAGAEALLNEVLANPKLGAHAPGRLLAEFELGKLYSNRLNKPDKAADAFAKVVEALDDKSSNRLSAADQMRVLGNDPSTAYLNFGLIFLATKRDELAVKAFARGLLYDEDNPQIALLLAETLLKLKKGEQALALVERSIQRQPQGVEAYDLLAKVLKALNRDNEITPRLEEAARRDSKNVPLQYVLADRYRETGQPDKAEALYTALLTAAPTPQTYRALSISLLKRKKAGDLLKVICEALKRPASPEFEAVKPQLFAVAADDSMAEAMLDAGLQQLSAKPPTLPKVAYLLLARIANSPDKSSPNKNRRLEKLVKLQRLVLEENPTPQAYKDIADSLRRIGKYAEAAATIEKLIATYPNEKSVRFLADLADYYRRAGNNDAFKKYLDEAMKLDAVDADSSRALANLLSDIGRVDDAVKVLRDAIKREPNVPLYELMLGDLLLKFQRNEEAIKQFEDMLKHYGDNEELVKLLRPRLSVIYVSQGNYAKGEAELEALLQRNPDEPGPNNDLGYLYADQGKNLEKAETMIRKALQEDPTRSAYLDSLGWVLYKRGKFKEALEEMKKAAERMKVEIEAEELTPDTTIYEHLGDVYFQLQQLDKAASSWREAVKIGEGIVPPDKKVAEIRKKLEKLEKLGPMPKPSANRTP